MPFVTAFFGEEGAGIPGETGRSREEDAVRIDRTNPSKDEKEYKLFLFLKNR